MSENVKDKFITELRELIIEQNELALKSINDQNQESFKEMYNSFFIASDKQVKATESVRENLEKHISEVKAWQERAEPIVEIYTNLNGTKKVLKYVFYTLSLVIGFVLSIKALFPNLFHK